MSSFRVEKDFLGTVKVPSDARYGIFTARARENFQISGLTIDDEFLRTLAEIKKAASVTNAELGLLDQDVGEAIGKAADEIIEGMHWEEFPLDVFQAGAGTPWNMNMNEVLANMANRLLGSSFGSYSPVHPNDHVNMSQSSNDVVPNAIRLTVLKAVKDLIKRLARLEEALEAKAEEFRDVRKSGRTHTRDAVPISLGQEFKAYSTAIGNARERIEGSTEGLRKIFLGGTAVGTGLNTHPEYSERILEHLEGLTGLELFPAEDFIEKTQFMSDFLVFMDALASLSTDLSKICNDLMLLSSGPRTGLNEILLPPVEPGSSIMPGKVNPSILECVNMVCFQVMGNRAAVGHAAMSGTLDLNVYTPVIAFNLFNSIRWLTNAVTILTDRCVRELRVNRQATDYYFEHSNAIATLLSPIIGYEAAAEIAKESFRTGIPIESLAVEKGLLTAEQMEEVISHSCEPNLHVVKKIIDERIR